MAKKKTFGVEGYFRAQLGEHCCEKADDRKWLDRQIPVDSPCGAECKAAIDHAAALVTHVRAAIGHDGEADRLVAGVIAAARKAVIVYAFG